MIFIWGSYSRQASLRETAMCSRCNWLQPVSFQRVWRTGHFFFFPLFSIQKKVAWEQRWQSIHCTESVKTLITLRSRTPTRCMRW